MGEGGCYVGTYRVANNDASNCVEADAGKVSSTSATALQADSGATQQASCGKGFFKKESGAVSLFSQITSAGTGHTANQNAVEYVPVTDGSGTGAKLSVTTDGSGVVTAVTVKESGSGYDVGDTLTVTDGSEHLVITVGSVDTAGKLGVCAVVRAGYVGRTASTPATSKTDSIHETGAV